MEHLCLVILILIIERFQAANSTAVVVCSADADFCYRTLYHQYFTFIFNILPSALTLHFFYSYELLKVWFSSSECNCKISNDYFVLPRNLHDRGVVYLGNIIISVHPSLSFSSTIQSCDFMIHDTVSYVLCRVTCVPYVAGCCAIIALHYFLFSQLRNCCGQ